MPVPRERSAISMCFPAPGNYPPRALVEIVHRSAGTTRLEETTLLTAVRAVITCSHKLSNIALTYAIAAWYPSEPAKRQHHSYNGSFHERFKAIFRQAVTPAHLHLVRYLPLIYWDVLGLGFQAKLPLKQSWRSRDCGWSYLSAAPCQCQLSHPQRFHRNPAAGWVSEATASPGLSGSSLLQEEAEAPVITTGSGSRALR